MVSEVANSIENKSVQCSTMTFITKYGKSGDIDVQWEGEEVTQTVYPGDRRSNPKTQFDADWTSCNPKLRA